MDIGSIVGRVVATVLSVLGMGSSVTASIDFPSLPIVLGGTLGAVLVTFPIESLLGLDGIVKDGFLVGDGPSHPRFSNETRQGRARNRRVEIGIPNRGTAPPQT